MHHTSKHIRVWTLPLPQETQSTHIPDTSAFVPLTKPNTYAFVSSLSQTRTRLLFQFPIFIKHIRVYYLFPSKHIRVWYISISHVRPTIKIILNPTQTLERDFFSAVAAESAMLQKTLLLCAGARNPAQNHQIPSFFYPKLPNMLKTH